MKTTHKPYSLLILFTLTIFLSFTYKGEKEKYLKLTLQERDALVVELTKAYNTVATYDCISVKQSNEGLTPIANSINYLKQKAVDSTSQK